MIQPQPILISLLCLLPLIILAQQPYTRGLTTSCDTADPSTSLLGYACNGQTQNCRAYLTFRAQTPFDTVSTISSLLSSDPAQLAQLNSVPVTATFDANRTVLIPVNCSCSDSRYQVNASYAVRTGEGYLAVANNVFQGLSTCQALQDHNTIPSTSLLPGDRITVPLRCACPTRNQTDSGANYLLSYLVTSGQYVSTISPLFGVSIADALAANGLSESDTNIYPMTTLLIPLRDPPTSSQVTAPQPPPPPSPTPPPPSIAAGGGSSRVWIYAVVGGVGGLLIIGSVIFCLFIRKKKKKPEASRSKFDSVEKPLGKKGFGDDDADSRDFLESISSIAHSLNIYTFQELKKATEDFSPNCLIKGSVYRATINSDEAAVKKMIQGDVTKEISLLNKINHFNLIRLSGVSFNSGDWYLVYEYAPNGSLADWIERNKALSWNKRLQIALDVAAGLNYLHRYTSPPHVHKDLNSSNVLLDQDFRAKIANFGLARSVEGQEGDFALTRHIVGTKGYMAPEYLENGVISPKIDVYAFGVLLLEILTGKEVSSLHVGVSGQLSEILSPVLSGDDDGRESMRSLMDPLLGGEYPPDLAFGLLGMVDSCLKKDPSERPSMDDVFKSLSRISTSVVSGEWAIGISENQTRPSLQD